VAASSNKGNELRRLISCGFHCQGSKRVGSSSQISVFNSALVIAGLGVLEQGGGEVNRNVSILSLRGMSY
ncbi:MAG: hypothetical protein KAS66_16335, partial [Candidatus Omnitrophica bacterium]|nr:hypothetical protein [Candidatus Omnitrophota bacterium]